MGARHGRGLALFPGGRWCVDLWAWAAAVKRDPKLVEGVQLNCEATSGELRDVLNDEWEGQRNDEACAAVKKVNEICGRPTLEGGSLSATMTHDREDQLLLQLLPACLPASLVSAAILVRCC